MILIMTNINEAAIVFATNNTTMYQAKIIGRPQRCRKESQSKDFSGTSEAKGGNILICVS